jgi:predicted helicase
MVDGGAMPASFASLRAGADRMTPRSYYRAVEDQWKAGISTEHSYRRFLQDLLEGIDHTIRATNEPRRTACGAPDYIVTRHSVPLGYVEAKDVGTDLDAIEGTEQILRYRGTFPNFILTDYLRFIWYVNGERRLSERIGTITATVQRFDITGARKVVSAIESFINFASPLVGTAPEFAARLAAIARMVREVITLAFDEEERLQEEGQLHDQFAAFQRVLIEDLKPSQFADMYAQTITYGMFAAAVNRADTERLTRVTAAYDLPRTNPFLRRLFGHIAGPDLDERVAWVIDDLAEFLNRTDFHSVLEGFGQRASQTDPVIHFYETFLRRYDPELREARGVYYTPEPVVRFIVRSVDELLKTEFSIQKGLADWSMIRSSTDDGEQREIHLVQILDPATGTGTFLREVISTIYEYFSGNRGMWPGYVSTHLLPRIHGFELLMAPYAVAHMKLGLALTETGYDFRSDERLRVFLTNTLEEAHLDQAVPLFTRWLSEEAASAAGVKREIPVMVVLGNPPYSRASYNQGEWIEKLMEEYKTTVRKEESQIQGLSNDYIKFIRFAQWKLENIDRGILAYITGHGFLDGPQARDMRSSLLRTFDKIYVLNLHGSARREVAGLIERDEPVFEIQQGTAITIAVRGSSDHGRETAVQYSDLFGSIDFKFAFLGTGSIRTIEWTTLRPAAPYYFFTPKHVDSSYSTYWSITDIFGTGNRQKDKEKRWATGFASQQDEFAISFSEEEVHTKIRALVTSANLSEARELFRLCTTDQWNYEAAKSFLGKNEYDISTCSFRPFDERKTVFSRHVVSILRTSVMAQLDHPNLALVASRVINDGTFSHVFVTTRRTDKIFLSSSTSTNAYVFPLYIYPGDFMSQADIFEQGLRRSPNLSERCIQEWGTRTELDFVETGQGDGSDTFGPEAVFYYVYAVLHSPLYRRNNESELCTDFPRVPMPRNRELFLSLWTLGAELARIHLLRRIVEGRAPFPVNGSNKVEKVAYQRLEASNLGRIFINKAQFFANIKWEVWQFRIGKYYPVYKWLADRKGRLLSFEDIHHYQLIVGAIERTMEIMDDIDNEIAAQCAFQTD